MTSWKGEAMKPANVPDEAPAAVRWVLCCGEVCVPMTTDWMKVMGDWVCLVTALRATSKLPSRVPFMMTASTSAQQFY